MTKLNRRHLLAAAAASLALPARASAFPTRAVTVVVPYPPGGQTDQHLRIIAEAAARTLGQPVVIQNRPGGSATFSASSLMQAAPDGYTLGILPLSVFREPHINRTDYDPRQDFSYLLLMTDYIFGLAVRADAPWRDWSQLAAAARKAPGRINLGGTGANGSARILVEEASEAAGLQFNFIPYKGDAEVAQALLGGHIDAAPLGGTAMAHIAAGKMRYIANLMESRAERLPELPTLREQGVDAWMESPYGLAGPRGLPAPVARTLHDAFRGALQSPASLQAVAALNQKLRYLGPEAYRDYALRAYEREGLKVARLRQRGLLQ